jgi:hypothetical protein
MDDGVSSRIGSKRIPLEVSRDRRDKEAVPVIEAVRVIRLARSAGQHKPSGQRNHQQPWLPVRINGNHPSG